MTLNPYHKTIRFVRKRITQYFVLSLQNRKTMKNLIYPRLLNFSLAYSLLMCLVLGACQSDTASSQQEEAATVQETVPENPPAPGFKEDASDAKAIEIADQVMKAMGGRENWDKTRLISWNFFGARTLYWDKATHRARIDYPEDTLQIILHLNKMEGKVQKNGVEIQDSDSLQNYIQRGKSVWINDSYWLVMPFKMKDSGVTLKYLREDTTQRGEKAHVLQLTFDKVGNTPENKYEVYVDQEKNLVTQWAYYREATQDSANFVLPWLDYKKHGNILLSGNRDRRQITDIVVTDSVPETLFDSFAPVELLEP